ncbi:hypothetical protein HYH03_008589 [Edaphochlamys debaryana]|uniref:Uncharacterized protein n=1 Tax=Edaphochlamys debaryana TaxID=47281 RepID=A0A836BYP0_9CHLO|nr:hypothetical protein HYH03_008589 [Edaphochlamys debaryana]|eukprot:KAG2493167.1 hypothetical protein HYH03_008589 [Edaphochlamys debaryana]
MLATAARIHEELLASTGQLAAAQQGAAAGRATAAAPGRTASLQPAVVPAGAGAEPLGTPNGDNLGGSAPAHGTTSGGNSNSTGGSGGGAGGSAGGASNAASASSQDEMGRLRANSQSRGPLEALRDELFGGFALPTTAPAASKPPAAPASPPAHAASAGVAARLGSQNSGVGWLTSPTPSMRAGVGALQEEQSGLTSQALHSVADLSSIYSMPESTINAALQTPMSFHTAAVSELDTPTSSGSREEEYYRAVAMIRAAGGLAVASPGSSPGGASGGSPEQRVSAGSGLNAGPLSSGYDDYVAPAAWTSLRERHSLSHGSIGAGPTPQSTAASRPAAAAPGPELSMAPGSAATPPLPPMAPVHPSAFAAEGAAGATGDSTASGEGSGPTTTKPPTPVLLTTMDSSATGGGMPTLAAGFASMGSGLPSLGGGSLLGTFSGVASPGRPLSQGAVGAPSQDPGALAASAVLADAGVGAQGRPSASQLVRSLSFGNTDEGPASHGASTYEPTLAAGGSDTSSPPPASTPPPEARSSSGRASDDASTPEGSPGGSPDGSPESAGQGSGSAVRGDGGHTNERSYMAGLHYVNPLYATSSHGSPDSASGHVRGPPPPTALPMVAVGGGGAVAEATEADDFGQASAAAAFAGTSAAGANIAAGSGAEAAAHDTGDYGDVGRGFDKALGGEAADVPTTPSGSAAAAGLGLAGQHSWGSGAVAGFASPSGLAPSSGAAADSPAASPAGGTARRPASASGIPRPPSGSVPSVATAAATPGAAEPAGASGAMDNLPPPSYDEVTANYYMTAKPPPRPSPALTADTFATPWLDPATAAAATGDAGSGAQPRTSGSGGRGAFGSPAPGGSGGPDSYGGMPAAMVGSVPQQDRSERVRSWVQEEADFGARPAGSGSAGGATAHPSLETPSTVSGGGAGVVVATGSAGGGPVPRASPGPDAAALLAAVAVMARGGNARGSGGGLVAAGSSAGGAESSLESLLSQVLQGHSSGGGAATSGAAGAAAVQAAPAQLSARPVPPPLAVPLPRASPGAATASPGAGGSGGGATATATDDDVTDADLDRLLSMLTSRGARSEVHQRHGPDSFRSAVITAAGEPRPSSAPGIAILAELIEAVEAADAQAAAAAAAPGTSGGGAAVTVGAMNLARASTSLAGGSPRSPTGAGLPGRLGSGVWGISSEHNSGPILPLFAHRTLGRLSTGAGGGTAGPGTAGASPLASTATAGAAAAAALLGLQQVLSPHGRGLPEHPHPSLEPTLPLNPQHLLHSTSNAHALSHQTSQGSAAGQALNGGGPLAVSTSVASIDSEVAAERLKAKARAYLNRTGTGVSGSGLSSLTRSRESSRLALLASAGAPVVVPSSLSGAPLDRLPSGGGSVAAAAAAALARHPSAGGAAGSMGGAGVSSRAAASEASLSQLQAPLEDLVLQAAAMRVSGSGGGSAIEPTSPSGLDDILRQLHALSAASPPRSAGGASAVSVAGARAGAAAAAAPQHAVPPYQQLMLDEQQRRFVREQEEREARAVAALHAQAAAQRQQQLSSGAGSASGPASTDGGGAASTPKRASSATGAGSVSLRGSAVGGSATSRASVASADTHTQPRAAAGPGGGRVPDLAAEHSRESDLSPWGGASPTALSTTSTGPGAPPPAAAASSANRSPSPALSRRQDAARQQRTSTADDGWLVGAGRVVEPDRARLAPPPQPSQPTDPWSSGGFPQEPRPAGKPAVSFGGTVSFGSAASGGGGPPSYMDLAAQAAVLRGQLDAAYLKQSQPLAAPQQQHQPPPQAPHSHLQAGPQLASAPIAATASVSSVAGAVSAHQTPPPQPPPPQPQYPSQPQHVAQGPVQAPQPPQPTQLGGVDWHAALQAKLLPYDAVRQRAAEAADGSGPTEWHHVASPPAPAHAPAGAPAQGAAGRRTGSAGRRRGSSGGSAGGEPPGKATSAAANAAAANWRRPGSAPASPRRGNSPARPGSAAGSAAAGGAAPASSTGHVGFSHAAGPTKSPRAANAREGRAGAGGGGGGSILDRATPRGDAASSSSPQRRSPGAPLSEPISIRRPFAWQERETRHWLEDLSLRVSPAEEAAPLLDNPLRNGVLLAALAARLVGAPLPAGVLTVPPRDVRSARTNILGALDHLGLLAAPWAPPADAELRARAEAAAAELAAAAAVIGGAGTGRSRSPSPARNTGAPSAAGRPCPLLIKALGSAGRGYALRLKERQLRAGPGLVSEVEAVLAGEADSVWGLLNFIRLAIAPQFLGASGVGRTGGRGRGVYGQEEATKRSFDVRGGPGINGVAPAPGPAAAAAAARSPSPAEAARGRSRPASPARSSAPAALSSLHREGGVSPRRMYGTIVAEQAAVLGGTGTAARGGLLVPGGPTADPRGNLAALLHTSGIAAASAAAGAAAAASLLHNPTAAGQGLGLGAPSGLLYRPLWPQLAALPYSGSDLAALEASLLRWLMESGAISRRESAEGFSALLPMFEDGTFICWLVSNLSGRPIVGAHRRPLTEAARRTNWLKAIEALRTLPGMCRRFLAYEEALMHCERPPLTGLLEDLHRLADGVAPAPSALLPECKPYLPYVVPEPPLATLDPTDIALNRSPATANRQRSPTTSPNRLATRNPSPHEPRDGSPTNAHYQPYPYHSTLRVVSPARIAPAGAHGAWGAAESKSSVPTAAAVAGPAGGAASAAARARPQSADRMRRNATAAAPQPHGPGPAAAVMSVAAGGRPGGSNGRARPSSAGGVRRSAAASANAHAGRYAGGSSGQLLAEQIVTPTKSTAAAAAAAQRQQPAQTSASWGLDSYLGQHKSQQAGQRQGLGPAASPRLRLVPTDP